MKKIVIVDDNEMFLKTLKDFIENTNKDFKCMAFSNPENALRYILEEKEIHTVVSDYEMPQMSGLTLAQRINDVLPEIKVIVMSGHDINYLRKHALRSGIDENKFQFLCKSNIINLCVLLNS